MGENSKIQLERGQIKIVNVASVPKRSPFRYPGGKTWLVPTLRRWLSSRPNKPEEFVEPFAGGGIISLTVVFENLADHVTMVELDRDVGAVWSTLINGNAEWLANKICDFDLNADSAKKALEQDADDEHERAFQTILRNRIQRGGIMAKGAGWVKFGEGGKGMRSRWYPETLKRRILDIARVRHAISFINGDGIRFMQDHAHNKNAIYFIDPPYTAGKGKRAGSRLYTHCALDHDELFRVAAMVAGDFLMTYDDCPDVRSMANKFGFQTALVPMKSTHHAEMNELLIGRDLSWV
jgi:DNA adenine methylase